MPIYEYECPTCGQRTEELRTIAQSAEAPPECTQCRIPTKRVLSAPSVIPGRTPMELNKVLRKRSTEHSAKIYKEQGPDIERALAERYAKLSGG